MFERRAQEWQPSVELTPPVVDGGAEFGSALVLTSSDLDDDGVAELLLVVGAPRSLAVPGPGAVYSYALHGGEWSMQSRIEGEHGFGHALLVTPDGSSLAVASRVSSGVVSLY